MGKRIAIIAGQLVVGGAERQLYLWLANMDRNAYDPLVLTLHPGNGDFWEKPIESLGIPLMKISPSRSPLKRLMNIVRVLRPYKPVLIQGWHLFTSPYAGAAGKVLGVPSLGGLRDTYQSLSKSPLVTFLALNLVDAFMANSLSAAEQLQSSRGRKPKIIYSVQNGLEAPLFQDRREAREALSENFSIPRNICWIGTIGRLDRKKRFDLMLKSIARLSGRMDDFALIICGDGPEKSTLIGLAEDLNIKDKITFTGEIPNAASMLKAFDIFCFPSMDEGLSNAVMEAAAAGLPVAAWDLPFNREILENGKSALLIAPGDLDGMRDALVRLVHSVDLRARLGAAARDRVLAKFTVQRYVETMARVYEDLLLGPGTQKQVGDDFRIS